MQPVRFECRFSKPYGVDSSARSSAGFSSAAGVSSSSASFSSTAGWAFSSSSTSAGAGSFAGARVVAAGAGVAGAGAGVATTGAEFAGTTGVATGFSAAGGVREAEGLGAAGVPGAGGGTSSYGLAGMAPGIDGAVVAPAADVGVQHATGCVQHTGRQQALSRRHLTGLQQHLLRAWASLAEKETKNMTAQMIAANFLMVQPRGPFSMNKTGQAQDTILQQKAGGIKRTCPFPTRRSASRTHPQRARGFPAHGPCRACSLPFRRRRRNRSVWRRFRQACPRDCGSIP